MRNILLAITLSLAFGVTLPAVAAEKTVSMNVERMTCALCPLTVRKAMERVDGVQHVEVDYDTKTATVTFDDTKATAADIAKASTDVGYPSKPVSE